MDFDDFLMDAKLHIETTGRDETCADNMVAPYEPTTYTVLERLASEGYVTASDHLVDYGSGLGRVVIFLVDRTGCKATGVEVVRKFYEKSRKNLEAYESFLSEQGRARGGGMNAGASMRSAVDFYNKKAQDFVLPMTANRLFFFNPFHLKTFKSVMTNILESYRENPRGILMFFYYPQDSYIAYLSTIPEVMFVDEIDCTDLFHEEDGRNRIMIFELEDVDPQDAGSEDIAWEGDDGRDDQDQ